MTPSTCRLQISFAGLCMFVPAANGKMYVLLPDAEASNLMPHSARLVYSGDYVPSSEREVAIQLELHELDYSEYGPTGTPRLPATIVNVARLGNSRVKPRYLTGAIEDFLAARVILPGGLSVETFNVADLEYDGETKALATAGGAIVVAPNAPLDSDGKLPVFPGINLRPIGGRIDLFIANLMPGDFHHPPRLNQDAGQTHFAAYYSLLEVPPAIPKMPHPPKNSTAGTLVVPRMVSMDPYTCMLGGGCPDGTDNC
jgi:hypothetical protein